MCSYRSRFTPIFKSVFASHIYMKYEKCQNYGHLFPTSIGLGKNCIIHALKTYWIAEIVLWIIFQFCEISNLEITFLIMEFKNALWIMKFINLKMHFRLYAV